MDLPAVARQRDPAAEKVDIASMPCARSKLVATWPDQHRSTREPGFIDDTWLFVRINSLLMYDSHTAMPAVGD